MTEHLPKWATKVYKHLIFVYKYDKFDSFLHRLRWFEHVQCTEDGDWTKLQCKQSEGITQKDVRGWHSGKMLKRLWYIFVHCSRCTGLKQIKKKSRKPAKPSSAKKYKLQMTCRYVRFLFEYYLSDMAPDARAPMRMPAMYAVEANSTRKSQPQTKLNCTQNKHHQFAVPTRLWKIIIG